MCGGASLQSLTAPQKGVERESFVESDFDFCARRAAEEFLAAGRATSAVERIHHRQLAEKYAEVVRQLVQQRQGDEASSNAAAAERDDPQANAAAA
jgi:hypothetical protein